MPPTLRHPAGLAPTIAFLRGQGVRGAYIYCADIRCARNVVVVFDAMGLPEDTPFPEIARRRRWVCSRCGGRNVRVQPDWPDPRKVRQRGS